MEELRRRIEEKVRMEAERSLMDKKSRLEKEKDRIEKEIREKYTKTITQFKEKLRT